MRVNELTLDFVNSNFYECEGKVFRKDGKKCSNTIRYNYYTIWFKNKQYLSHRILWVLYNQKTIPEGYFIDHIDNNGRNNLQQNLRLATKSQNQHNCKINSRNKTGVKGLSIRHDKGYMYYYCEIQTNNKALKTQFPHTNQGFELSKQWLITQREQLHGEFGRSE